MLGYWSLDLHERELPKEMLVAKASLCALTKTVFRLNKINLGRHGNELNLVRLS